MNTFKDKFWDGIKYTALSKYSNVVINLVTGVVLARLLSPEDYGVVAIVSVFVLFFGMLTTMGIGAGVVQFDLNRQQLSALFTFSILIGSILALLFAFFSYWIASFYNSQIYIGVGQALAISVFIKAASAVPLGLLQKKIEFKKLAAINISINLGSGCLGIVLALQGFSYWSLIIRTLVSAGLTFVAAYYLSRKMLSINFKFRNLNVAAGYSTYVFLFDFVNYFSRNLDNLLIGKFIGARSLGVYDKAYSLMKIPLDNLVSIFSPVLHPLFSEDKASNDRIFEIHQKLLKALAFVGVFISVICFYCSQEIIIILYGPQWTESAFAFKWLGLSIWIQMILSSTGPFFLISGKTKHYSLTGFLSSLTIVSATILGIFTGSIEKLSMFIAAAFFVNLFQTYAILYLLIFKKNFLFFLKTIGSPLLVGLVAAITLSLINDIQFSSLVSASLKGVITMGVFAIFLLATNQFRSVFAIS